MITYNNFKNNLINLLTQITDNLHCILGHEHPIIHHIRHYILPKITISFSIHDYFSLLKTAAAFRFLKLTNSVQDINFETYFTHNTIHDFKNITLFIENNRHVIKNDELIANLYCDIEDWLMEYIDVENARIISEINYVYLSDDIPHEDIASMWFLIIYLALYKGSSKTEWTKFLNEIVNVGISEKLHLVFFPKSSNFISSIDAINMIPNVINKFYLTINTYHKYFENLH